MSLLQMSSRVEKLRNIVKQFDDLETQINSLDLNDATKVGRPTKNKGESAKRPGRPRKDNLPRKEESASAKRGPGRPRKTETTATKEGPKESTASSEKRGPGRPRKDGSVTKVNSDKMTWKKVISERLNASPTNLAGLVEAAIKSGFKPESYKDGLKGLTQNIRTTLTKMQNDKEVEKSEDKNYSMVSSAATAA